MPVFIAKRAKGGASWRGADNYASMKPGAVLLASNLEGRTPRERAREIARLRGASSLKRAVDHWSLSLDPRLGKLSEDQWCEAARIFLHDMGYGDRCAFTLTRHTDEPQDHAHLMVCRIRTDDLSVVSDSHDFKRSHIAAAKCAEALGLKPLPPREDARSKPAPRDAQVRASKRSLRRGTAAPVHGVLVDRMRLAVGRATSPDDLVLQARELGLELELVRRGKAADAPIQGLKVRPIGVQEWSRSSDLARGLGWSKVVAKLEQNVRLRAALKTKADDRDRRLEARRLAQAINKGATEMDAKGGASNAKTENLLEFLDGQSRAPVPSPATPASQMFTVAKREAQRSDREQEARRAAAEVDDTLRKASTRTLVWLKSLDRDVPKELLSQAQIERLLILCLRIVTLGMVKLQSSAEAELASRAELANRARDELARRREEAQRGPVRGGLAKVLRDERDAVEHRRLAIGARASMRALARLSPPAQRPPALTEAGWDARRHAVGKPTIREARRAEQEAAKLLWAVEAETPRGLQLLRLQALSEYRARKARAQAALRARQVELQARLLELEAAKRGELALLEAEQDVAIRADAREAAELEHEAAMLDKAIAVASQSRPSEPQAETERERTDAESEYGAEARRRDRPRGAG